MKDRKLKYKFDSSKSHYIKSDLVIHSGISARPFASTTSNKADPLGFVALSFATPYPPSLLANPLAGAFILLMGMGSTLFFLTSSLPLFFAQDPTYAEILCRLDNLFGLYETFLAYERSGIDIMLANLNNFTPETITNFYFSLQELVTVRESVFDLVTTAINSPEIEFLERPLVDRINEIHEDLRLGGNNLMSLLREIEDILNIPAEERIPYFDFEV
jgi:hypothetical protein